MILTMKRHFSGEHSDDKLDRAIWRQTVREAGAIARLGYPVRAVQHTASGNMISIEANLEGAARVLAQEAIQRGKATRYFDCQVKDIRTSKPEIVVTIPRYPDQHIRCEYERQDENDITRLMHIGQVVTIVGTPVWRANRSSDDPPTIVEIAYILDAEGHMIGSPSFLRLIESEDVEVN